MNGILNGADIPKEWKDIIEKNTAYGWKKG